MVETWKRSSRAVRETTLGICKTFQPRFGRREKASDWLVVFGKLVDRKPRGTDKYVKTRDLIISTLHLAVRHFVHVPVHIPVCLFGADLNHRRRPIINI